MILTFPNVVGTIEVYMDVLRAICGDTEGKSMIDLCCCTAPNTPKLGFEKRLYVDIFDRKLDQKEEQQYFHQMDVLDLGYLTHWDVALCLDGIEHLSMENGIKLKRWMQTCSDKQVFFTPTTELFGMADDNNMDPEAHRSLWNPDWFQYYACIMFPNYHKVYNSGAFFVWRSRTTEVDFLKVKNILSKKEWAKN